MAEHLEDRVKNRFLWTPKRIDNRLRWLKKIRYQETYVKKHYCVFHEFYLSFCFWRHATEVPRATYFQIKMESYEETKKRVDEFLGED